MFSNSLSDSSSFFSGPSPYIEIHFFLFSPGFREEHPGTKPAVPVLLLSLTRNFYSNILMSHLLLSFTSFYLRWVHLVFEGWGFPFPLACRNGGGMRWVIEQTCRGEGLSVPAPGDDWWCSRSFG